MKKFLCVGLMMMAFLCLQWVVSAEEIELSNGDKISGEVISDEDGVITLSTISMGEVKIDKAFIKEEDSGPVKEEPSWAKKISLGYSQTGGNTKKSYGSAVATADKKTDEDEWNLKYEAHYSSADKKMDGKKFYASGRYAFSFGDYKKWYNFYKLEGDQDRFANVDYRVIPSVGVGYWFADEDDWKAKADLGIGYEYTNYSDDSKSTGEPILIPHAYIEKKISDKATISEDITLYPSLKETGEYRLRSETALTSPLADNLDLKVSLIDDFDSDPKGDSKKNDYRFISALEYSF